MFATDFLFDNQRASDFGCIICSFDGGAETASGGEIEYNVVKTPNRDKYTFYGAQFDSVITWTFSICKNPCKNDTLYFDQYEESMITKWLLKTDGYKSFQFNHEGYEDIFYNVYINLSPHQIAGKTVGFDLEVTSDCAYGFSDVITRKATINNFAPLILNIHSDINTYILPYVKVNGTGNAYISNDNDELQNADLDKATEIKNMAENESWNFIMDSDTDMITVIDSDTGQTTALSDPNKFNWYFLRLVDGINTITTKSKSDIDIEIQYREPRRVIV